LGHARHFLPQRGGEAAKEFVVENPYIGDGAALGCNPDAFPPPPG
jgi:hypothetical protein